MRAGLFALALIGCTFSSTPDPTLVDAGGAGNQQTDAAALPDAPLDAPVTACLGQFTGVCVPPPTQAVMLTTQTIDTGSSPLCGALVLAASGAPGLDACVIAGTSITVPGSNTISVTGRRPLVLWSSGAITISGVLDAASHATGTTGPAADSAACMTPIAPSVGNNQDGGGGGGGSFGAGGNIGGRGAISGTAGGAAAAVPAAGLRGGCTGIAGAGLTGNGGAAGHGGGAVLVVAQQTLTIDGILNASGGAGGGGNERGGGGGGGSGGMIVLDAAVVNVPGKCFANGGGGGEGGDLGRRGAAGSESTAPNARPVGGTMLQYGGDGGAGGYGDTPGGSAGGNGDYHPIAGTPTVDALGGGGGGGGSVGVIQIYAAEQHNTDDASKVAPRPSR